MTSGKTGQLRPISVWNLEGWTPLGRARAMAGNGKIHAKASRVPPSCAMLLPLLPPSLLKTNEGHTLPTSVHALGVDLYVMLPLVHRRNAFLAVMLYTKLPTHPNYQATVHTMRRTEYYLLDVLQLDGASTSSRLYGLCGRRICKPRDTSPPAYARSSLFACSLCDIIVANECSSVSFSSGIRRAALNLRETPVH